MMHAFPNSSSLIENEFSKSIFFIWTKYISTQDLFFQWDELVCFVEMFVGKTLRVEGADMFFS